MSIRRYLVLILISVITLVIFIATIEGYKASMVKAGHLFDMQLSSFADTLINLEPQKNNITVSNNDTLAFQLWRNKQLVSKSSNAPNQAISVFKEGFSEQNFNAKRWRVFSLQKNDTWIIVAQLLKPRFELAEKVILSAVTPIILTIPLLSLIISLIISYGLKPLQQLKTQLTQKGINDLSTINVVQAGTELQPIIDTLNRVLSQLDSAYEREKRFASDAAHELRTPLSVLKINAHNLQYEIGKDNLLLNNLITSVERMAHIVEQILKLNQTNPEQFSQQMQKMSLTPIVQQVIAQLYPEISMRKQTIEFIDGNIEIYGNEFCIVTLVQNLIANASKYTPIGGQILVSTKQYQQEFILQIEDSGPGIAESEINKVFDRFYRIGGDCNNSSVVGCGLGLAIVKHIVILHQAKIRLLRSTRLHGLKVTISFPSSLTHHHKEQNNNDKEVKAIHE